MEDTGGGPLPDGVEPEDVLPSAAVGEPEPATWESSAPFLQAFDVVLTDDGPLGFVCRSGQKGLLQQP